MLRTVPNPPSPSVGLADGVVIGRILHIVKLKTTAFLMVLSPPALVQCVWRRADGAVPPVGSVVRLHGRWQPTGGRRPAFVDEELVVGVADVLCRPTAPRAGSSATDLDRGRALAARSAGQRAAESWLRESGFVRVDTPIVSGPEATLGATNPFTVTHAGEHAYLTVSNVLTEHAMLEDDAERVYALSRLFWAHRSSDCNSLTELFLIEFACADAGQETIIALTENLVDAIARSVAAVVPDADRRPLTGLPVLTAHEVARLAEKSGVDCGSGHVLPKRVDRVVAETLGVHGFWVTDVSSEHVPYYVRKRGGLACSVELRLNGIGDVASGSELTSDMPAARRAVADWDDVESARRYLDVVRQGHSRPGGMSVGFDRLLVFLLRLPSLRKLVPSPRIATSFASARSWSPAPTVPVRPLSRPRSPGWRLAPVSARIAAATRWLERSGVVPLVTSVFADGCRPADHTAPRVNYFGRTVFLTTDRAPAHHRLLGEHPTSIYEIGPVAAAGERWWSLNWVLDVTIVDADITTLTDIAIQLVRVLSEGVADKPFRQVVRRLGRDCFPEPVADLARYAELCTGWGHRGTELVRCRTFPSSKSTLLEALGNPAGAADSLGNDFVPAGGVSISLSEFPGIHWPNGH
jgi:hypothetical protein